MTNSFLRALATALCAHLIASCSSEVTPRPTGKAKGDAPALEGVEQARVAEAPNPPTAVDTMAAELSGKTLQLIDDERLVAFLLSDELQAGTSDEQFLGKLISILFARPMTDDDRNAWLPHFQAGNSRREVTQLLLDSEAMRQQRIQLFYARYLGRAAQSGEDAYWLDRALYGMDEARITTGFVTSVEYFEKSTVGATTIQEKNKQYVQALFRDLLQRAPASDQEAKGAVVMLNGGKKRSQVVDKILQSKEFATLVVREYYQAVLGREPDQGGLAFHVDALAATLGPKALPTTAKCVPSFPAETGAGPDLWLRGDGGWENSVPNTRGDTNGRVVWSFGDSASSSRPIIFSNVAVTNCINGVFTVEGHYWDKNPNLVNQALFNNYAGGADTANCNQSNGYYESPRCYRLFGHPIAHDGKLYFIAPHYSFNRVTLFDVWIGLTLVVVDNPSDNPMLWKKRYLPIMTDENLPIYPMYSPTIKDGALYVFGGAKAEPTQIWPTLHAFRIPLSGLEQPARTMQYFGYDATTRLATWITPGAAGFPKNVLDYVPVMEAGNDSAADIRYNPALRQWEVIKLGGAFGGPAINMATSKRLLGPWSPKKKIYHINMVDQDKPAYREGTICYLPQNHFNFNPEPARKIQLSYSCNSLNGGNVDDVYTPRFFLIDRPASQVDNFL